MYILEIWISQLVTGLAKPMSGPGKEKVLCLPVCLHACLVDIYENLSNV